MFPLKMSSLNTNSESVYLVRSAAGAVMMSNQRGLRKVAAGDKEGERGTATKIVRIISVYFRSRSNATRLEQKQCSDRRRILSLERIGNRAMNLSRSAGSHVH